MSINRFHRILVLLILLSTFVSGCFSTDQSGTSTSDTMSNNSTTTSSETFGEVSSDLSSLENSSFISSVVSKTASVTAAGYEKYKSSPYYESVKQVWDLSRTRIGYSFWSKNGVYYPDNAVANGIKYKQYGMITKTDEQGKIYLTFNLGTEYGYTTSILNMLKEKNCKATFFIVGSYAKANPSIIKRIIEDGHTLGNHGMSHKDMPTVDPGVFADELMSFHNYMINNYSYEMKYYRPPSGSFSVSNLSQAQLLGYTTLQFSYAYRDWNEADTPSKQDALDEILKFTSGGMIYQLHTVTKNTESIVSEAIDYWRENGYELAVFS